MQLSTSTSPVLQFLSEVHESLLHLAFPHVCEGCGSDILDKNSELCLKCFSSLPATNFHMYPNNPIEKMFWGRLPLANATAQYYFTKESLMQHLMHQVKYRGNKELGFYLGRLMGRALASANRFSDIDAIVPLPLFRLKEKRRGFNQATILCEGIAEVLDKPVLKSAVMRNAFTDIQTKKNRIQRWQNMEGRFQLLDAATIEGKHVLLVDDVVTTGATLEACGTELLKASNTKLSVATLCFSSGN